MKNLMEEYLTFKSEIQSSSEKTLVNYRIDLKVTLPLLTGKTLEKMEIEDIKKITPKGVIDVLNHLKETRKMEVTTLNRKMASIKDFYRYYSNLNGFNNVLGNLKKFNDTRLHEIEYIENDGVKAIVKRARKRGVRDGLICGLLFNTGLRSQELLDLTVSSVQGDTLVVVGKGDKCRRVQMNATAQECLKAYLEETGITEGKLLNLTYGGLRYIYTQICNECGIDNHKVHTTRKSFTSNLINKGADMQTVSRLLGHSSVSTLQQFYFESNTRQLAVNLLD